MWVLLDNYDSFTYILHHYLLQTGNECVVYRNDAIGIDELTALQPERIIISPGPETPLQAGISMEVIRHFHDRIPILGVCLGHQALGMFFGAQLRQLEVPVHGKRSVMTCRPHPLFNHIPTQTGVGRYHSLFLDAYESTELVPLATTADDHVLMALAHPRFPCIGVQFHPESVLTDEGMTMIRNWAAMFQ